MSESIQINNETLTFNKIWYVDTINGSDDTGDGSESNSFQSIAIANNNVVDGDAIFLKGKEILTSQVLFEYNISIIGDYEQYNSSIECNNNRLLDTSINKTQKFYKIYFNQPNAKCEMFDGYRGTHINKGNIILHNCIVKMRGNDNGRTESVLNESFSMYNCIRDVYGTYDTYPPDWGRYYNIANTSSNIPIPNITYRNCMNNATYDSNFNLTNNESLWKNQGLGTNPDGSQAHIGVYGGPYAWGNWKVKINSINYNIIDV